MKKIRTYLEKLKEDWLTAKNEKQFRVCLFTNCIFIFFIFSIIYFVSAIISEIFQVVGICMIAISIILLVVFMFWDRAFAKTIQITAKILFYFFARYGMVVSKDDWKWIRKQNKKAYKFIWDKENIGHCYAVAWVLALSLEDAKVMYCSVEHKEDYQTYQTAHAVVVKNNCIYDTNLRRHYDFDDYIEFFNAEVYQIFDEEVYCKESFFDDVREDFKKWCAERNVDCNPQ